MQTEEEAESEIQCRYQCRAGNTNKRFSCIFKKTISSVTIVYINEIGNHSREQYVCIECWLHTPCYSLDQWLCQVLCVPVLKLPHQKVNKIKALRRKNTTSKFSKLRRYHSLVVMTKQIFAIFTESLSIQNNGKILCGTSPQIV